MGRAPVFASVTGMRGHEDGLRIFGIFDAFRESLHEYITGRFSGDSADFISAVTIGEVHFDEGLKEAFNATGLAHILSISGTHFGLFSVVAFGFFVFLIKRLPYNFLQRLTIYLSPSQAAALLCFPLMVLYLGISGGSVPAVRSFVMIGLFLAGLLIGRKGFWVNSVLLAASALVLWDPEVLQSLSFQLSFIAVLFIGFAVERRDEEGPEEKKKSRIVSFVTTSLRLTLAAAAGTAPLVAYSFHYLSVISPLSNLLVAPLIGFVVIPLALVSSFTYLAIGVYLFAPLVGIGTDLSLWFVRMTATVPFADIRFPSFPPAFVLIFYALCLVYLAFGRKKRLLILPFLPLLLYGIFAMFQAKVLSVTFLDIGQGDAAVVELPDGKTMVIDAGRTGHETAAYLKYLGKRTIDALVITHSHPDHAGGMDYLLRRLPVTEVWDNGRLEHDDEVVLSGKHRPLERGDVIEGKAYRIDVLHPYPEFYTLEGNDFVGENNDSLVLRMTGARHSFLFAGDVEDEAEEDLSHLAAWLKSDVLKVPHHGGKTSVHPGLLFDISPSIAVISAGRDNAFGHPSPEMIEELSNRSIYRTDLDGAIKVTERKNGLKVKTYKDFAFERADTPGKELSNLKRLFTRW
jgi:competence protein ComEC